MDSIFNFLKVRGNPVVAIPNRGVLLAAGSDDPAGLVALVTPSLAFDLDDPLDDPGPTCLSLT